MRFHTLPLSPITSPLSWFCKMLFLVFFFVFNVAMNAQTKKPLSSASTAASALSEDEQSKMSAVSISNGKMQMTAINYGARIQSLTVDGVDVVLGFPLDSLQKYSSVKQNFGAVVGRYIGRILGGHLKIGKQTFQLQTGSNGDCSHGGTPSFSQQYWQVVGCTDSSLTMRYVSPDGENGFPGELALSVTYTLLSDALRIDYEATTTKPTVLNPSNHTFFNLTGNLGNTILNEQLTINSDKFALYDANKRVTGKLGKVSNTPFDFRRPTLIGERIDASHPQLAVTKGYDHCYKLNNNGKLTQPVAILSDSLTRITMEVYTTEPAMQIYTANSHNGSIIGKNSIRYQKRNAICFETMHFPDSPNKPQWPSTLLIPGETFRSTTIFRFPSQVKTSPAAPSATSGYVPVSSNGSIHYESQGEGVPVILLHGHTLDLRMWEPQLQALLSAGFRVIRPDFRGYGHSTKQAEGMRFTHTDDIITLMDSLHIDRCHIVGLSMGSFVASELLAMHPERLLTATLASGNIRKRPGPSTPFDSTEIAQQDAEIQSNVSKGESTWRREWIEQLIKGGGTNGESIRASLTQQVNDWDGWLLFHREGRIYYANEAWDSLKSHRPQVPTLILSGEHEHKSPRNTMLPYLPNGRQVVIPDCGHMSNMERPAAFNALLIEHLRTKQ